MAGTGHQRRGQAVLYRRSVGRRRLYVRGYASRNGRRAPYRFSVSARRRYRRGDDPAGRGCHDRGKSGQNGGDDGREDPGDRGEHELRHLSVLRRKILSVRGKPYEIRCGEIFHSPSRLSSDRAGARRSRGRRQGGGV